MDLIQQIPKLNEHITVIHDVLKEMSSLNSSVKKKPGIKSSPGTVLCLESESLIPELKSDVELVEAIMQLLKSVSASVFEELTPSDTILHEIKLVNLLTRPVKQKLRPVPFNVVLLSK
ncbi:unnamed protein product [Brachionus calyciflorus]|uniref:Uncharacterized protein n=1 Tax=Brachionus calyciflorus TaxID=104777 RepID=A0A814NXP6_9BILA|nr:unnamed protein product [Brachionus calyciflorus]